MEESASRLKSAAGILIFIYYCFIWSVSLLGLSQAREKFGRPRKAGAPTPLPSPLPVRPLNNASSTATTATPPREGVSILRPLAGLDHNLLANLSSSFEQDFPSHLFEVILSVRNEEDQALAVAQEVCSRYPHIQSCIIIGDEPSSGVNPKIANLVRSYAAARFDILWVLDSQVQLSSMALHGAVTAIQSSPPTPSPRILKRRPHGSRIGLAHHCPLAVTPCSTSLGSHIEAVFLGTNHAKMYLAINSVSIDSCVMGKSNFYRKSDLAQVPDDFFNVGTGGTRGERGAIGSSAFGQSSAVANSTYGQGSNHNESATKGAARPLARFGIFLAEDNMLALSLWKSPLSLAHVLLDGEAARMSVGDVKSVKDYIKRRVRWIRVRRHMVPAATYFEPLTESIVCGLIATWAFGHVWFPFLLSTSSQTGWLLKVIFFALHMMIWHFVDFAVLASLQEAGRDARGSVPTPVVDFANSSQVFTFRLAWICRELLAFPIWAWALCGSTVTWRDRRYRILSDARAARYDEQDKAESSVATRALSAVRSFLGSRRKGYESLSVSEDQQHRQ